MFFVLILALLISILLESTVMTLPLAFILLLCYSVLKRTDKVFISAFFTGIFLDIFTVRTLGSTSIYFLIVFAIVLLYQRKYEIVSYPFVAVSTFVGSYLYLRLIADSESLTLPGISMIIALMIFGLGKILKQEGKRKNNYT